MRWDTPPPFCLLGHRGAPAVAPENTLAAFDAALAAGAVGFEFDVQLSADGVPVIIHDTTVDRTTNGRGAVATHTAAALGRLDAGDGQAVPTLEALFARYGDRVLYNLELKSARWRDVAVADAAAKCIRRHGLARQVLVSSFNPLALRRMARQNVEGVQLGFLHYAPRPRRLPWLVSTGAVHPYFKLVTPAYMAWARRHGLQVNVWTVNALDEAQRLQGLGVQTIITDDPAALTSSTNG
jgi:glycerophosphoryl diester phosphodiesterase